MRILLVEDDFMIAKAIKNFLEDEYYIVDCVSDAESCEVAIKTTVFQLIILDINLPDKSGLDLIKKIRLEKNQVPVLFLTARSEVSQKVEGLNFGADDYLTKPFDFFELLARIRSLVRRSNGSGNPILEHKNIFLDPVSNSVEKINEKNKKIKIDLSPKEFVILKMLMENIGKTVSRQRLENSLYSWDYALESNAIEVHIHNLRKKIGQDFIKTVRGFGYIIN
jgi:DNA-binding response OmpR family regulator